MKFGVIELKFFDYYGLPLPMLDDEQVPLGAVVAIKTIDKNGQIAYQEFKSPDLHAIEALGMLDTFTDTLRTQIMASARKSQ